MSLNLVYFKAHLRGFDLGGGGGWAIKWTSRDIKEGLLMGEGGEI